MPTVRADRLHLECVRDDEPSEPELAAQDVVEDLPAHRGGRVAERPYDDVRGHDRLHARGDGRAERLECDFLDRLDHRKREVRVDRGVAVAGEVLGARRDTRTLQPADEGADVSGDELSVRAERANPDDRVERVRVHVRDGREVEVDPGSSELRAHGRPDALGQVDVVHDAERAVPRVRASGRGLEPRHVATLLVDRDQQVVALGAQVVRQRAQLLGALDVPCVQDDAAEAFSEAPANPVGRHRAFEAGKDAARGQSLELGVHALTAPAVSPNAIFRCTSRKKITTGIAVSVDAAISPPQSMLRLVP